MLDELLISLGTDGSANIKEEREDHMQKYLHYHFFM